MLLADQEITTNQDPLITLPSQEIEETDHEAGENEPKAGSMLIAPENKPFHGSEKVEIISHKDEGNKSKEASILVTSEGSTIDGSEICLASVSYSSPFTGLSAYAGDFLKLLEHGTIRLLSGLQHNILISTNSIRAFRRKMFGYSGTGDECLKQALKIKRATRKIRSGIRSNN
ncbi:hypothetical protein OCU04_001955 [Sclerotinia nivalis]|uniref:Uncharacterized protein n=1 Tax=Sclerotinia nivalis TaxID=352851 RepID=A0A9X0AZL5_9HELO|nr:hypothetical protein OCU04_001955 [Sclerotinia nivalis]